VVDIQCGVFARVRAKAGSRRLAAGVVEAPLRVPAARQRQQCRSVVAARAAVPAGG